MASAGAFSGWSRPTTHASASSLPPRSRRASPRDDMVTALVEARVDGTRLSDHEIVCTVIVLLNAGHEATVNTLGNGTLAFVRHPDQWQRVVDGDAPADAAIEEMIRFDPPLQLFERWVL